MEHSKDINVKKYFICVLEFLLENDIVNKWKSFVLICIIVYFSVRQKSGFLRCVKKCNVLKKWSVSYVINRKGRRLGASTDQSTSALLITGKYKAYVALPN
jgi:hypothetical protein